MTEKKILPKKPYPLGAHIEGSGVRFAFVSRTASCGILLYDKTTGKMVRKVPFSQEDRIGNVYCRIIEDIDVGNTVYLFYEGDHIVPDERARSFPRKFQYGKERAETDLKAGFLSREFDWGQDSFPRLPYHQVIGYCMHVRGFTRHTSSNVANRGTFAGIVEKIPYLKEIGITTIELQPAYEFTEIPTKEERRKMLPSTGSPGEPYELFAEKLNYWGYKKGFYYMPKSVYAASDDPETEFKTLVRALHENGMELVMQFYFPKDVKRCEIPEILRFWVLEYHVDGFHLMGENLSADMLAMDDVLADTKLWYYQFDTNSIYEANERPMYPNLAEYNDSWYYDMRRFLKGDENTLESILYHMRHIPEKAGCIHYLTNYYGFTLADLVSYDHKHNEANGENGQDGNNYNCSWNCGEEGVTRRKKVRLLRLKQMKNAMCLVLLSNSTPMIFMGDEFGNTQKGNNNPYCQDNTVTWLDWKGIDKNKELLEFWKMLVDFRKAHPIIHPQQELRLMDYIACGCPDLSYHGQNAWRPQTERNFRHIGIMLCGKYAKVDRIKDDANIYIAMNMHWGNHMLALPKPPKGMKWEMVFSTETDNSSPNDRINAADAANGQGENAEFLKKIGPRSIVVYISVSKGSEDIQKEQ